LCKRKPKNEYDSFFLLKIKRREPEPNNSRIQGYLLFSLGGVAITEES
jgi:hypothetical protein